MLSSFFGLFCFCTRSPPRGHDPSLLIDTGRVPNCVFCDVTKEKGFDIVWQNDSFIAFKDYNPAATHHLLVITKRHVESVKTLTRDDAELVKEMADIGHRMLDALQVSQGSRRLGFHIPPFNSVQHLHLHVLALPYKSTFRSAKYLIVRGSGRRAKGFSWFAEVDQALRILEYGKHVGVFPC